jgi:hypothetical protein
MRAVAIGNGQFVGVGGYITLENRSPVGHAVAYSSIDGTNWIQRLDIVGDSSIQFWGVTYGDGQFVAVGDRRMYNSADGTNWNGIRIDMQAFASAGGNGQWVIVGAGGAIMRMETSVHTHPVVKLGITLLPGRQMLGSLTGLAGQTYAIDASTNLIDWILLRSVTMGNEEQSFSDPSAKSLGRRFYRARWVNP